jgi:hypothetical protein
MAINFYIHIKEKNRREGKVMRRMIICIVLCMGLMWGVGAWADSSKGKGKECQLATGDFDAEAAASNQITTCIVRNALKIAKKGHIVRLGRDYVMEMPLRPNRFFELEQDMPLDIPAGEENDPRPWFGPAGLNHLIANQVILNTQIGQVGTQFDGPGHIGRADDNDPRFGSYHLGLTVEEVNATPKNPEGGLQRLGIERIKPIVARGILVDLAPFGESNCTGHPCWNAGEEITLADVEMALAAQKMRLKDIKSGDVVLLNTGWGRLWNVDNARFNSGAPGIGLEVANWLVDRSVVVVGSDTWPVEVVPRLDALAFPVHARLIVDAGIFLHEILMLDELIEAGVYEFAYIFIPVPISGAAGSPGSPIALY